MCAGHAATVVDAPDGSSRRSPVRLLLPLPVLLAGLLVWCDTALAGRTPPVLDETAAVDQYRESLPSATGPTAVGTVGSGVEALPRTTRSHLFGGGVAASELEAIAAQSADGAPQLLAPPRTRLRRLGGSADPRLGDSSPDETLFAVARSVLHGADGRVGLLLGAMITVAAAAWGVGRAKRPARTAPAAEGQSRH